MADETTNNSPIPAADQTAATGDDAGTPVQTTAPEQNSEQTVAPSLTPGGALAQARANGHSWDDINNHLALSTTKAVANGYTPEEIDSYLGYADTKPLTDRLRAIWTGHIAQDPSLIDGLKKDNQSLDLTLSPTLASDYTLAMKRNEVKGPRDFADHYAAAALDAAGLDNSDPNAVAARHAAAAAAADNIVSQLPSRRDLVDASVSLDPDNAEQIQHNLLDHWADTGQHPIPTAVAAPSSESLWQKITNWASNKYAEMEAEDIKAAKQAEANRAELEQTTLGRIGEAVVGLTMPFLSAIHLGQEVQLHGASPETIDALSNVTQMHTFIDPTRPVGEAFESAPIGQKLNQKTMAMHAIAAHASSLEPEQAQSFLDRIAAGEHANLPEAVAPHIANVAVEEPSVVAGETPKVSVPPATMKTISGLTEGYRAGKALQQLFQDVVSNEAGSGWPLLRFDRDKDGYLTIHLGQKRETLPEPATLGPQYSGGIKTTPDFGQPKPLSFPMQPGEEPKEYMNRLILTNIMRNNQDRIQLSNRLEQYRRLINKHLPDFENEIKKGPAGDPYGSTVIGALRNHIETYSQGGVLDPTSPFLPVANTLREIEQETERMIRQAMTDEVLNPHALIQDHWAHRYQDPSKAIDFYDKWVGRQGFGGGLKQRTIPTEQEAYEAGLVPKYTDPIEHSIITNLQTRMYLRSRYMLRDAKKAGIFYERPMGRQNPGDLEVNGVNTMHAPAEGVITRVYGPPAYVKPWNYWLSQGLYNRSTTAGKLLDTMNYFGNIFRMLKLIDPRYHFRAVGGEAISSALSRFLSSAARLEPQALLHAAEVPISPITYALRGLARIKAFQRGDVDPIMQAMHDAGQRIGATQEYAIGHSPTIWRSIARGSLGREIAEDWHNVFANSPSMRHLPLDLVHFIGKEFGRFVTSMGAPLFQHLIPAWEIESIYTRKSDWLRRNPEADPVASFRNDREIVGNVQDRLGELNQDRWLIPRWIKDFFNLILVSPGWEWGNIHWIGQVGRSLLPKTLGGKFNETAVTSLIAFAGLVAAQNALRQYFGLGYFPWQSSTPLMDLAFRRTSGTPEEEHPHRAIDPGYVKDFANMVYHYLMLDNPADVVKELVKWGRQKLNPGASLLVDLATGTDAIGHNISHTPGGWTQHILNTLEPITMTHQATPGSGISREEQHWGTREAPLWVENYPMWKAMMERYNLHTTRQELWRARREALKYGETPPNTISANKNIWNMTNSYRSTYPSHTFWHSPDRQQQRANFWDRKR